jgi:hypothetical protein
LVVTQAKRAAKALLIVFVTFMIVAGIGIVYISRVDEARARAEREADRRWCQLLITLDDANVSTPPETEFGRAIAVRIHELRTQLGC